MYDFKTLAVFPHLLQHHIQWLFKDCPCEIPHILIDYLIAVTTIIIFLKPTGFTEAEEDT